MSNRFCTPPCPTIPRASASSSPPITARSRSVPRSTPRPTNWPSCSELKKSRRSMMNHAEHVIEVKKLTKRYGDLLAVNDISFSVRRGEVFALLGPNGAGKTTTVEILDTLRRPTSGKVRLLGMDVTKKKHDIVRR